MVVNHPHRAPDWARARRVNGTRTACALGLAAALAVSCTCTGMAWAEDTPPDMPDSQGGGEGGGGSADTQSFDYSGSYSGALSVDGTEESSDGETYDASDSTTNTVLVQNAGTLDLTDATLTKSGDDSDGDSCNFYGVNSILLAVGEDSTARVADTTLSADSEGSNGLFATDGATIWANNVDISTTSDNSRGLDATYGGTVIANDATIDTEGDHCAGAANDRGGGYVSVTNSTIDTAGSGSPVLYSTGAVEADNVTGTASGSQIAGMEGLNIIRIANSSLESTITEATASDPIADGVIIYQSTSGDADTSTGERALFEVRDSSLTSAIESGTMFYLTNTSADIVLSNTVLDFDTSAANLITVEGNDSNNWGTSGSNGADVTLSAHDQTLEGAISVDTISSLDVYLVDGSTYTGATEITENAAGGTVDEPLSITIEDGSTWVVTGNSTVSNLSVADGAEVVDADGDAVSIVADGDTVVEGDSDYTITVNGTYSTDADTSGAIALADASVDRTDFDDYYGTSTAFGTNGTVTEADIETGDADDTTGESEDETGDTGEEDEDDGGFFSWLSNLWDSFLSLFS